MSLKQRAAAAVIIVVIYEKRKPKQGKCKILVKYWLRGVDLDCLI